MPERCLVLISIALLGPQAFGLTEGAGKPDHLQPHPLKQRPVTPSPHPDPASRRRRVPKGQAVPPRSLAPGVQKGRKPGARSGWWVGCVPVSTPGSHAHPLTGGGFWAAAQGSFLYVPGAKL